MKNIFVDLNPKDKRMTQIKNLLLSTYLPSEL